MAKSKVVYTIARMNESGTIVIEYLRPNYLDPREALLALRDIQHDHPWNIYKVFRYAGTLFDERELRDWIDESEQRA